MPVLEAIDLSIRFGGLQALLDVALEVDEFEIVGLIGPNGAGKTTCFNCITGFYRPQSGRGLVEGDARSALPAPARAPPRQGRTLPPGGVVETPTRARNLLPPPHSK